MLCLPSSPRIDPPDYVFPTYALPFTVTGTLLDHVSVSNFCKESGGSKKEVAPLWSPSSLKQSLSTTYQGCGSPFTAWGAAVVLSEPAPYSGLDPRRGSFD